MRFWTVVGGDEVNSVKLDAKGVLQLAFHPDGRSIAVATDGAILRLTAPDGAPLARLEVPVKGVYGLAFDTDGNMYLGTDAADGILMVNAAKQGSPYYPGVVSGSTVYLTWGTGANLFQGKGGTTKTIVKINSQKASAP